MTAAATARRTTTRFEYKWIVATVFVCGMFIDILDTTIVNVALPDLGREFHATTASIEWIVLGYLLSLAVFIPASGWIGDRLGTRRVFLFAMAFAFVPMQAATYANISPADTGRASAIYSTQRQVAAALGVATLGTVLVSRINSANAGVTDPRALADGALSGYHLAFLVGTILVALASLSGLLIHDEDAASTMLSRAPQDDPELAPV